MNTQKNETFQEKFIPGETYKFDPPLETRCISVAGGEWKTKMFSEGWCLKQEGENTFVFQGAPTDNSGEHFFRIDWGKGSIGTKMPSPNLKSVT